MSTMPFDTFSDPKPVGIWIRVSTEDQVTGESPEHHEYRARAYAEMKGWSVVEIFRLDATSGKSVKDLPETRRMLEHVRAGHIKGLIFSKLARLARNTKELLEFADIFREYDADLISLQESIDTSTPAGRLFYTIIAAMAQWEREEISSRVAASVPVRAKLGKSLGGQAPFGYKWKDGRLVLDPKEAPVRKRMFELFLEHRRKKAVARLLNEAGYRTRRGSLFTGPTIDRLLRDPIAKGKRRANYTKSLGDKRHWTLKPESEWIWQDVPPVVSAETWDEVNQILDEQRQSRKRVGRKPVHLFAGVTYCACGHKMYVPSNTPKYVCYKCRNKIPVVDLEKVFHEQLKTFVLSPDDVAEYLKQADGAVRDKEELAEILEDERKKVTQEMDKVYHLYVSEQISAEGFGRVYKPLEERLLQLEDEIPRVHAELDFIKIQYLSSDEILNDARSFSSRWPELTLEEKRRIIDNTVHRIEVRDKTVLIELAFTPTSTPSSSRELAKRERIPRDSLLRCHLTQ